jgi:arginine:ornithine antiporter/lysine permease
MAGHAITKHTHAKRSQKANLGLGSLTALVVGSIVGSGIFNLVNAMLGDGASTMALIIAWLIMGTGILLLALCFYFLNKRRPDLDAGVYSYARAGFGKFMGFNSVWGYWVSAWMGNVAYATMIFSSLNYFIQNIFVDADGNITFWTVVGASVLLWAVNLFIGRGIKKAAFLNILTTIGKVVPIIVFIVAAALAFKFNIFSSDLWGSVMQNGTINWGDLTTQVSGTMLALVFAFIGVEGASVFSGQAKNHKDVGRATIIGILTVISIYVLITVLSLGVMSNPEIAALTTNKATAMAQILEHAVGAWGSALVSIGVILSVAGAWLAWTMFAMEIPYEAAKGGNFPKLFAKTNKRDVPVAALLCTSVCIQVFFLTYLVSDAPYNLGFSLCSSMILVPYLLVALFQLKESLRDKKKKVGQILLGLLATVFAIYMLYAGGVEYLLLMTLLYAAGIGLYIWMQREQHEKLFKPYEAVMAVIIVGVGVYALWWLALGGGWTAIMG